MWSSFAWDLPRNLTNKRSLFCTKFILKNLYFAENSLYKKPLFLRETARGPASMQDVSLAAIFSWETICMKCRILLSRKN